MGSAADAVRPYEAYISRPFDDVLIELEHYAALLMKWQDAQNLVSRETLASLWTRHVADSLQVLRLLRADETSFLDLGSGGGLPAIPLAIACKGRLESSFVLVEPNARKASFLRTVARELSLPIAVIGRRVEEIDSRETILPDVITSRALAPLGPLFGLIQPFFGASTRAILHKGREHVEELAESRALWQFDVVIVRSDTNPGSALLEITNLRVKTVS